MEEEIKTICGRCYDINVEVFPANCIEKPEDLKGQPIGMYHCPDCGAMVLAGVKHPPLCKFCLERKHPAFDLPIFEIKDKCPHSDCCDNCLTQKCEDIYENDN